MRIFERDGDAQRENARRGANRSFNQICDIFFVCFWGKHPFPTRVSPSRRVTEKDR